MNHTPSITYFDRVAAVGSRILQVLGGSPVGSKADYYLYVVAEIYEMLAQIHDNLVDVTIDVSQARTMDEAIQALARVRQMGIKEALRAQEKCDVLHRLGLQLRDLPDRYGLTADEKDVWDELCLNLEDSEEGTSILYNEKLYELRVLPDTESSLDFLKAKVKEVSDLLVIQKAQFERLAKLAKAMYARRS